MRRLGLVLVAVGAVIVVASLALLQYADFGSGPQKLWDVTTRLPLIITIVAGLGGLMAVFAIFSDAWLLPVLATGAGFFLFGELFPVGVPSYSGYKAGFWVAIAGAVLMSVAGVIALIGTKYELELEALGSGREGGTAASAWAATGSPATDAASVTSSAAAAPNSAPAANSVAAESRAATPSPGVGADRRMAATTTTADAPSAESRLPPAGWYADPAGQAPERYWSGSEWTHQLR
jgi:hypothetical protein